MDFSERLRALRTERNLTQKDVYKAVGMSPIGYQRYEYGDREPAYPKLLALADYFNVSLDYLVGRGSGLFAQEGIDGAFVELSQRQ